MTEVTISNVIGLKLTSRPCDQSQQRIVLTVECADGQEHEVWLFSARSRDRLVIERSFEHGDDYKLRELVSQLSLSVAGVADLENALASEDAADAKAEADHRLTLGPGR